MKGGLRFQEKAPCRCDKIVGMLHDIKAPRRFQKAVSGNPPTEAFFKAFHIVLCLKGTRVFNNIVCCLLPSSIQLLEYAIPPPRHENPDPPCEMDPADVTKSG